MTAIERRGSPFRPKIIEILGPPRRQRGEVQLHCAVVHKVAPGVTTLECQMSGETLADVHSQAVVLRIPLWNIGRDRRSESILRQRVRLRRLLSIELVERQRQGVQIRLGRSLQIGWEVVRVSDHSSASELRLKQQVDAFAA